MTAEPSSVLREPPEKSGPQEQRPRDPLLGQSRKASCKKKGQAEWERQPRCWCIAGRRAQTFQGLGELWAWGELSWGPGEGSVCPGTQDQPLPNPCFVFPALWFPNLFGLKFVSNFFFCQNTRLLEPHWVRFAALIALSGRRAWERLGDICRPG